jgi:integrase/recombinase XerD
METYKDAYFKRLTVLGYSPETMASHQWRLKAFLEYLQTVGVTEPEQITPAHIRNYQTYLFERMNRQGRMDCVSSRNNMVKVAKRFIKFLLEEGTIEEDPGESVDLAIEPKRLPRYVLTEGEMKRLLDAPDLTTALGYRDRAILEVFYSSGIRRSELINLRLNDVDLEAGLLRVNAGKGNKDRMVPLGKIAGRFLKGYIKEVRPRLVKDPKDDHIFLSLQGRKICKCMLGLRLKDHLKKAGIEKNVSIHTLRATCATHCLRGKKRGEQMHPRHLMELLGHASMETLNPYLAVSIADLKEAHGRCHPRERVKVGG